MGWFFLGLVVGGPLGFGVAAIIASGRYSDLEEKIVRLEGELTVARRRIEGKW